jgi:branched-chain amino acid transport system ATP-binding protein
MLLVEDLHASYGPVNVLRGLSLAVKPGEVIAVLGRNGMGKTTALRTIMGLHRATRGRVLLKAADITHAPTHRIARMGIGYVPQGRRIFPSLSVLENLKIAAKAGSGQWNLAKLLELFPNLEKRLANPGNKLSGGEQQMLAVARALASNPQVVLMDEPTEGLAPLLVQELSRVMRVLKEQGSAILLVEQHVGFALQCADQVLLMNKGQIVERFTSSEADRYEQVRKLYLGV